VASFWSRYVNKVDRKGRVSVPARFRAILAEDGSPGLLAYLPLKDQTIECCGLGYMADLRQSLDRLPEYSPEHDALKSLFGDVHELGFDAEGRILLPDFLRETAGIGDTAVFVGAGATFQIWDPDRHEAWRAAVRTQARETGFTLPPRSPPPRPSPAGGNGSSP
jgi:MraZ protein